MPMNSRIASILFAAGLSIALAGGYLVWRHGRGPAPVTPESALRSVTVVADDRPLPAFRLGSPGGAITNESLRGHWTFVFFGYTQCPDACPTSLSLLAQVERHLEAGGKPRAAVLFVSVDPRRDSMALLARYLPAFDPAFVGATGSDAELASLAGHLGVYYLRHDETDRQHYVVDHTSAIYLINPQVRLEAVFSEPFDAGRIAADFLALSRQ